MAVHVVIWEIFWWDDFFASAQTIKGYLIGSDPTGFSTEAERWMGLKAKEREGSMKIEFSGRSMEVEGISLHRLRHRLADAENIAVTLVAYDLASGISERELVLAKYLEISAPEGLPS